MASTTVLISGGNRGLGLGLVQKYAERENYTVIATARNPSAFPEVKKGNGSRVIVVEMDQNEVDGPKKMIEGVKSKGVTKLDIVICNAAIMTDEAFTKVRDIDPQVFEDHWRVNVLGFLTFFQATVRLMQPGGKFIFMSSGASVLDRVADKTDVTYGITKAGANYLARFAHFEEPELVIFPLSPGWVQTDMGNRAAVAFGREGGKAVITTEESCDGMVKVIDEATRESASGRHLRYDGTESKW